jgi:5-methylcytosine-specific restriction endonuclease McrA
MECPRPSTRQQANHRWRLFVWKVCFRCQVPKSPSEFWKERRNKDGLNSVCIECCNTDRRKRYSENPARILERNRTWHSLNIDKVREIFKKWVERNYVRKQKADRKWRDENSERVKRNNKLWAINNPEKRRAINSASQKRNPEIGRKKSRKYIAAHPEKNTINQANRRATKMKNGGKIRSKEWLDLKEKYNFTCLKCGKKEPEIKLTLDHVVPLVMGGAHSIENAQPLCVSCNSSKRGNYADYR